MISSITKNRIYSYLRDIKFTDFLRDIDNNILLDKIDDLLFDDIIDEKLTDPDYLNSIGIYYHIDHKINKAINYYQKAIEVHSIDAICNLSSLYQYQLGDIQLAKKYLLMGCEKNSTRCMYLLGILYQYQLNDIQLAKKYLLMGCEKNSTRCMYSLGILYKSLNEYNLADKYFLFGANNYLIDIKYAKKCIAEINLSLDCDFNIDLAIKAYDYLDDYNMNEFNERICNSLKLINKIKKNEPIMALVEIECVCCQITEQCVFMKCGHSICYNCYLNKTSCRLCK